MVPENIGDGRARFGVGRGVGQFIIFAKSLPPVQRADAAGQIKFLGDYILPDAIQGFNIVSITRLSGYIGHTTVHIGRPDGVAHSLILVHHRFVVLHIAGMAVIGIKLPSVGMAALIQKELGKLEIFLLTGYMVQLHQANLDFLMAGDIALFIGAEDPVDQIGVFQGHIQQGLFPGGLIMGHSGFVQMADVVQFVVNPQVRPAGQALPLGGYALRVDGACGIEIAILLLSSGDFGDQVIQISV